MPTPTAVLVAVIVASAAPVAAQTRQGSDVPSVPIVITTGEGTVRRAPDRAWVTIAAESRARTAQEAQRANGDAMTAVNAKLRSSGLPADAIQTTSIDLQPEFDYANGRQTLKGYVARNQVQVKVDTLSKLGDIIGSSVASGATNVSNVRFDVQDREGAEREALRLAVADARKRADAAAAGAGMHVDAVLRVEEQRDVVIPQPRPMMMASRAEAVPAAVPIESGEIEIRARVTMTAGIK
jgi:uncharacterized protein